MNKRISVIIPNHNGSRTIGKCLEGAFSSEYDNFEVVVVDDCSTDDSAGIIGRFPCRPIRMDKHSGASKARNTGAWNSTGEILFFIDSDCILRKDTLSLVNKHFHENSDAVIGGTYTRIPFDNNFFSAFQSIFINYSETKNPEPDYIAAHAMAIDPGVFRQTGGFPENFLPIIEDVEFSHRLRRSGYRLKMKPDVLVQHIFNFNLVKSLRNAFRKSKYWTVYSLTNRDIMADSGAASVELKANSASYFLIAIIDLLIFIFKKPALMSFILLISVVNLFINRKLITAFYSAKGSFFAILATLYYTMVYPLAVGAGAFSGILKYLGRRR